MQSDGKSKRLTASGDVFAGPARLYGVYFVAGTSAGSITVKDGGSGGATVLELTTPDDKSSSYLYFRTPIRCESTMYAALADVAAVTFIYA